MRYFSPCLFFYTLSVTSLKAFTCPSASNDESQLAEHFFEKKHDTKRKKKYNNTERKAQQNLISMELADAQKLYLVFHATPERYINETEL